MKNIIIKYAALAGMIAFMTLWLSTCNSLKNDISELNKLNAQLVADYDSCKNAKVFTRIDTVESDHIIEYIDRPVPVEIVRVDTVYDTISNIKYIYPTNIYKDTLKTDDFDLFWEAKGYLDEIRFPYYRLYDKTVTESNVIEKVRREYVYSPESALYLFMKFPTVDFNGLSGVGGGLDYTNKKGWGILGEYQRIKKQNVYSAGIKIRIL